MKSKETIRLVKIIFIILTAFFVNYTVAAERFWTLDIAPYFWAINMNGKTGVADYDARLRQNFGDILQQFQGGGMLWLDAHNKYFGVFANLLYSELSQTQDIRNIPIKIRNQFGIFSLGVNYSLPDINLPYEQKIIADILAGIRTTVNNTKLTAPIITIKNNEQWTDPLFGLKLTYKFYPRWNLVLLGDAGGIDNHYSYDFQGYLGFNPEKVFNLDNVRFYLGYRLLHQTYRPGSGLDAYLWDMNIFGPLIGVNFAF
jgi:hypothetical protein